MPPSWLHLVFVGTASRILTLTLGWLLCNTAPPLPWMPGEPPHFEPLLSCFQRWDAAWYMEIARDGYRYDPTAGGTMAFMPALPACVALFAALGFDRELLSVLIPNSCFIFGFACFGRYLSERGYNNALVWRTLLLLLAFPTAFFFSCPYQESLGFAGISIALLSWQRQRTGLACAGVFFASLARLTALAFPVALVAEWLAQRGRGRIVPIITIAAAWLIAVSLFFGYSYLRFDDPFAHLKCHRFWERKPPHPLHVYDTLRAIVYDWPRADLGHSATAAGLALALFAFLGVRAWRRRTTFDAVLILLPVMQATFTGTPMSLERIVLASFPAFLDLAEILRTPRRLAFWLALSIFLQVLLLNGYVHWQFMG